MQRYTHAVVLVLVLSATVAGFLQLSAGEAFAACTAQYKSCTEWCDGKQHPFPSIDDCYENCSSMYCF